MNDLSERPSRRGLRLLKMAGFLSILALALPAAAQVPCPVFDNWPPPAPEPRVAPEAVATFNRINAAVKTQPHRILFLGDSITERWGEPLWGASAVWDANLKPRGVLNAGVSGDRTEHLRWRLDHGNLDGPAPKGVIVMIGTNDLGHGRPPTQAAEGIRQVLIQLRQKVPNTKILLLGLTPRGGAPWDQLRVAASEVNQKIGSCADGQTIWATDIGQPLLDAKGMLSNTLSPDYLHFNAAGYERIAPGLDHWIDQVFGRS
ncbi:MAG TPA: GDSL-type esterase/lipase family protein [Stellaceae bacterium]|nr:GDSL-type esterase/lipase family protein [Stellaceae bacterium]